MERKYWTVSDGKLSYVAEYEIHGMWHIVRIQELMIYGFSLSLVEAFIEKHKSDILYLARKSIEPNFRSFYYHIDKITDEEWEFRMRKYRQIYGE